MAFEPQPDITPTVPEFKLPESNSISYALVQNYNNRDIYQNQFNSKSSQAKASVADCMTQFFHWEDNVITQYRSNYDTLSAKAVDDNGMEYILDTQLKVENLDQKITMGCRIVNINDVKPGKMGVRFTSGDTYEYGTTTINGSYELNGLLPEWGVIGNYIFLDTFNNWYQIEDVYYDSSILAEVLVLDIPYLSSGIYDICSSLYNRFNYNVYEFVLPMYDKKSLSLCVSLENTDTRTGFVDIKYSSEDIFVDDFDEEENVLELIYFNYNNSSDIYYSTKFYGLIRLPFVSFTESVENEQSNEKTSKTVIPLASTNYHGKTLSLERVPDMLMRKITQALSHKEVFINRIQYTVKSVDSEWVASTNSYDIEVEFFDAEDGFNPLIDRRYCGDRLIAPDLSGGLDSELDFEL